MFVACYELVSSTGGVMNRLPPAPLSALQVQGVSVTNLALPQQLPLLIHLPGTVWA